MASERHIIRPKNFANTHFHADHRTAFLQFLDDSKVPARQFEKDTALIRTQIRRIQMQFRSGIAVLGTEDAFAQHVKIESENGSDGHQAKITIRDKLEKVRGK